MAAFERISSGIPMMDQALDNIRLGDNVVWQVSELDQFRSWPGSSRPGGEGRAGPCLRPLRGARAHLGAHGGAEDPPGVAEPPVRDLHYRHP